MNYDIYFAGVGGQGILTIGKLLTDMAIQTDHPASFYPSKGIAQRGGFVKAQLRIGRNGHGSNIPEGGADLIVSMERSESLKVIHYIKKGGDFVLFSELWAPTAVALGKAPYPTLDEICLQVKNAGANLYCLSPNDLPIYHNESAPANLYVLGALFKFTSLKDLFSAQEIRANIQNKWKKGSEANLIAFDAGLNLEKAA